MKYLCIFILLFSIFACKNESADYVTLSGTITDTNQDFMLVYSDDYRKRIPLDAGGSFKDTLKVEKGYYSLTIGENHSNLFLKNGYDLVMTADGKDFMNSISYEGQGAENNNYVAAKIEFMETKIGRPRDYFKLEKDAFDVKVADLKITLDTLLSNRRHLDSLLIATEDSINRKFIEFLNSNYERGHAMFGE